VSARHRIELESVSRAFRTPGILDRQITLSGYEGLLRQLTIAEFGHESPTVLLTNQFHRSPSHLIGRCARRMLIENDIEDGIDFVHMNALSLAVAMKVNCDPQLTFLPSSLYRLLGTEIGNGYQVAKSRHLFRDFIDASAEVTISKRNIDVRFQRRTRNPLLTAAGLDRTKVDVPWLGRKQLRLVLGQAPP
jgi:hypothetical protein